MKILTQQFVVAFEMKSKMVRSGECSVALFTGVRSDPGVFPHVAAQLIRSGELPAAALPGAHIGLLPRV